MEYQATILPASHNAIAYASKYLDTMQLNMITLLESEIALYEAQEEVLEKNI